MLTRHFFKVLLVFIGLIALALIGIYWTSQSEGGGGAAGVFDTVAN